MRGEPLAAQDDVQEGQFMIHTQAYLVLNSVHNVSQQSALIIHLFLPKIPPTKSPHQHTPNPPTSLSHTDCTHHSSSGLLHLMAVIFIRLLLDTFFLLLLCILLHVLMGICVSGRDGVFGKGVKICRPCSCRVVLDGTYKWKRWGRGGAVCEASLALKMFDKTLRARTEMYSP